MANEKCASVMNYLAHAYFSFMDEEIMIGNMISDFVKGKKKFDYSAGIQKGITLHRHIDSFTDSHTSTREAKKFFTESVGLYAGAFTDVVYDHFLALNDDYWKEISLSSFSSKVYEVLELNVEVLPEKLQRMLPYMKSQNWLFNYQYQWGIERSFEGVARRAVYLNNSIAAFDAFIKHYEMLNTLSQELITDVKKYALEQYMLLRNS